MHKLVKHELGNYPQNPNPILPQETNQLVLISEMFTLRIGNVMERLRQVNFRMKQSHRLSNSYLNRSLKMMRSIKRSKTFNRANNNLAR